MLAAEVWHWWIGIVLVAVSTLTVVALVLGYLHKVVQPQHPKESQRP